MVTNTQTLQQVTSVTESAKYGLLIKVMLIPLRPILTVYLLYRLGFLRFSPAQGRWMAAAFGVVVGASSVVAVTYAFGFL